MPDLDSRIRDRSARLRERHPLVSECRVTIQDRPPHIYERRRFNARLDISAAGRTFVINRENADDPSVALDDAFAAAERRLSTLLP